MGKAAELRERLENGVREFMAGVTDADLTEVGPGIYYGTNPKNVGGLSWNGGGQNSNLQSACAMGTFTAKSGHFIVHGTTCPNGKEIYKITVTS